MPAILQIIYEDRIILVGVVAIASILIFIVGSNLWQTWKEKRRLRQLEATLKESESRVREIFDKLEESRRELMESMRRIDQMQFPPQENPKDVPKK